MLADGLECCGLLWCYYQLFGLSFWRYPFTAEDALVRKRWNVNFSKPVQMNKQTHLHLGWPEGEYIFSQFWMLGELFLYGEVWMCWIIMVACLARIVMMLFSCYLDFPWNWNAVWHLQIPSWGVQRHESINLGFIGIQLADRKMLVFDQIISDAWSGLERRASEWGILKREHGFLDIALNLDPLHFSLVS